MRFPDEIWTIITDLKRHKPLRIALDKILSNVVITWAADDDMFSASFTNGRFSIERAFFEGVPEIRIFFFARQVPGEGYTNYFPYSSEDLSLFNTFGISLVILQ